MVRIAFSGRAIAAAFVLSSGLICGPLNAQLPDGGTPDTQEGESISELMANIKLLNAQNELAVFKAELDSINEIEAPSGVVTKNQIRTQPPAKTHAQLRDLFWGMLEEQDHRRDRIASQPLRGLALRTKPVTAALPGLCRQDVLDVELVSDGGGVNGADSLSRPIGVTAQSWWAVTVPPQDGWLNEVGEGGESCAAFPADGTEFSAESDMIAGEGYLAWVKLREQALSGSADFLCQFYPADDSRSCAEQIAALPLESLTAVRRCAEWDGGRCYRVHVAGPSAIHDIFIEFDAPIFDSDTILHEVSLLSLTVVEMESVD